MQLATASPLPITGLLCKAPTSCFTGRQLRKLVILTATCAELREHHVPSSESLRRPAWPDPSGRQPPERGQAAGRNAQRGRFAWLQVRGVSRAGAHHLLSALVDGEPGRGRQILRGADARSEERRVGKEC